MVARFRGLASPCGQPSATSNRIPPIPCRKALPAVPFEGCAGRKPPSTFGISSGLDSFTKDFPKPDEERPREIIVGKTEELPAHDWIAGQLTPV